MKTVIINDEKADREAEAIYGGAASEVKVATRDELKESVGIAKPERRINLFKKRVKSPKGPMLHKPALVDEKLMLEPILKEKQRKEKQRNHRDRNNEPRSRDCALTYE